MIRVRILSEENAAAMNDLHAASFRAHETWTEAAIRDTLSLPTTVAMGCFKDERLVGFTLVQYVAEEAEILTIATQPEFRRNGLATQMLDAVEQQLRPRTLNRWLLEVAEDNHGAKAFYKKLGFGIDGERTNYYQRLEGHRVRAILMSKRAGGQAVE